MTLAFSWYHLESVEKKNKNIIFFLLSLRKMMLSRVQHCWSSLHNQEMIPTYSFVSFIRSGHLLLLLITFFLQQSRALSQLQTESSSTTTYSDLLPSYIFLQSKFIFYLNSLFYLSSTFLFAFLFVFNRRKYNF